MVINDLLLTLPAHSILSFQEQRYWYQLHGMLQREFVLKLGYMTYYVKHYYTYAFFKLQFTCVCNSYHLTSLRYSATPAIGKIRGFSWIISGSLKRWEKVVQIENKGTIWRFVLEGNIPHTAPAKVKHPQLSGEFLFQATCSFPLMLLNNHH